MDLVTGGAGFIGSHLAEHLAHQGRQVRVLDTFSTGRPENLAAIREAIDLVEDDVRNLDAVRRAVAGCEVVYHQAADVSVPRSVGDPKTTYDINVSGTLNVLLAARDAGCRRVVVASSSAVYGDHPELPKHEGLVPTPVSPYGASKLAAEHLCSVFSRSYGLEAVALRYFNVYGPRQDPASPYGAAIPKFLAALSSGERPVIYGDGNQTRDFVYVADVVQANLRAAAARGAAGRIYNVASGRSVSLNALLTILADLLGVEATPQYKPARPGDIRHSAADPRIAETYLEFASATSLEAGLARTIAAIRADAMRGHPLVTNDRHPARDPHRELLAR